MKNRKKGYIAAALGGGIGGFAFTLAGYYLIAVYMYETTKDPKWGEVYVMLIGCFTGLLIGEILGCWLVLRLGGYSEPGFTSAMLAFFLTVLILSLPQLMWGMHLGLIHLSWLLALIGFPLLARFCTNLTSGIRR
jgi:hypothetical protein